MTGTKPNADRDVGCVSHGSSTALPFVTAATAVVPPPPLPLYNTLGISFKTASNDRIYGLGQLEAPDQKHGCEDGKTDTGPCGTPLNRRLLPGQSTPIDSTKYHIAVPFLYSVRTAIYCVVLAQHS